MKVLRIIFSTIFGILLLGLISIFLLFTSINQSILKPYSTMEYLKESEMYQSIASNLPAFLERDNGTIHNAESIDQEDIMKDITKEVVTEKITSKWLEEKLAFIQQEIWDYILNKDNTIRKLDISDVREAFLDKLEERITVLEEDGSLPPEINKEIIINQFSSQFHSQINWVELYGVNTNQLDQFKYFFEQKNKAYLFLFMAIFIILFIHFFILSNWKRFLKWLGIILIVSSFISLIPVGLWQLYAKNLVMSKLEIPIEYSFLKDSFIQLIKTVSTDITTHIVVNSILLIIIGIMFLFLSRFLNQSQRLNSHKM